MLGNELELFEIINEYEDPAEAVLIAIKVFSAFLEQLEADQELRFACPQESA